MALSGTFTHNIGSWWRLRLTWSATQDVEANKSYIDTRLYWEVRDGYGEVYSSSSRTGYTRVDSDNTGDSDMPSEVGFTTTAGLDRYESRLIHSRNNVAVDHKSDGTLTVTLRGLFDLSGVYLSGTNYGLEAVEGTATLNTIPRESSFSMTPSWTAGNNMTLSIKRYSTSFKHELEIYVMDTTSVWRSIKLVSFTTSETSKSTSFTLDENTDIFTYIKQRSSAPTRFVLRTKNSAGTVIGEYRDDGTVTAPLASTTTFGGDFNIGEVISGTITDKNSTFRHTVQLIFNSVTYPILDKSTVTSWTFDTGTIASALYGINKTSKYYTGEIRIYTYYNGVLVRAYNKASLDAFIVNTAPTFPANPISYDDAKAEAVTLTGDKFSIIQGYSLFRARLDALATARGGADIKKYTVTANGVPKTKVGIAVGYFDSFIISASSNVTMVVTVEDTRGFTTSVSKEVTIIPYRTPNIVSTATRLNGYETSTTITLSGTVSPLKVGTANKNQIVSTLYKYRQKGTTTWTQGAFTMDTTVIIPSFKGGNKTFDMNNQFAFEIEVTVTDKVGSDTKILSVNVGQPILFVDSVKKSIGFNDYPSANATNEFKVNGRIVFGSTIFNSNSGGEGGGSGALFLNNSDITGVNGMYFHDKADASNGEGLNFAKDGIVGSTVKTDYDNFRVADGTGFLNNIPIFTSDGGLAGGDLLADVAMFMQDGQTITPTKRMQQCPNGWLLVWSGYDAGAVNSGWNFTYIPKRYGTLSSGGMSCILSPYVATPAPSLVHKYIYCTDTTISGHTKNNDAPNNTMVLRYVYSF